MKIQRAMIENCEDVAGLFDQYRQFYEQTPDLALATDYIRARLETDESVIFISRSENENTGFVQLYPSFCSVDAVKRIILYDLFVAPDHRREGIGLALMNQAKDYAIEVGAARLDLETATDNYAGQALYERLGYKRSGQGFYPYSLELN